MFGTKTDLGRKIRCCTVLPSKSLSKILDLIVSGLAVEADIIHSDLEADEQEAASDDAEKGKHGDDDLARKVETPQKARSFPVALEPEECPIEEEDAESSHKAGIPSQISSRPISQYPDEMVHDDQVEEEKPLEAIELIPYKHQVGGHTTLWRFSKRAVCKQLNNRENEFYENIERYHRDLLPFLPRCVNLQFRPLQ